MCLVLVKGCLFGGMFVTLVNRTSVHAMLCDILIRVFCVWCHFSALHFCFCDSMNFQVFVSFKSDAVGVTWCDNSPSVDLGAQ